MVGVSVQDADAGDTQTMLETLVTAAEQVDAVLPAGPGIAELVCDKGYHSNQTLVTLAEVEIRSYVSEPDRGRRNWRGKHVARDAVYANRRRIRGARGKRLLRRRGERLERPHAHLYATGGMRRVHLRGHGNILKRLLLQVCGLNLGLLMRQLLGVGTPRGLQGRAYALGDALRLALRRFWGLVSRSSGPHAGKLDRPIVDSPDDADSFTHSVRAARRQFCHRLLGACPLHPYDEYQGNAERFQSISGTSTRSMSVRNAPPACIFSTTSPLRTAARSSITRLPSRRLENHRLPTSRRFLRHRRLESNHQPSSGRTVDRGSGARAAPRES